MNAKRLLEIATLLGNDYRALRQNEIEQTTIEQDITRRMVEITPEGGWPGKNEAERNAARDKTCAEDSYLVEQKQDRFDHKQNEATCRGDIEALDAERRALEWDIRERLVERFGSRVNETPEPVDGAIELPF